MTKELLKNFPQEEYEALLEAAFDSGVHIVHFRTGRTGGATIAWRRAGEDSRNRMVEVAIAFCSPRDIFVRRIGTLHALEYFFDGAAILMPIGSVNTEQIHDSVRRIVAQAIYATDAYVLKD